jgi:hypothetical protein
VTKSAKQTRESGFSPRRSFSEGGLRPSVWLRRDESALDTPKLYAKAIFDTLKFKRR